MYFSVFIFQKCICEFIISYACRGHATVTVGVSHTRPFKKIPNVCMHPINMLGILFFTFSVFSVFSFSVNVSSN